MSKRPGNIRYFIEIARVVASRATCDRAHVGCVLVRDRRVIATGYNGSPPGTPHCDDVGHDLKDSHCISGDTVIAAWQDARHESYRHRTVSWWADKWKRSISRSALLNRSRVRVVNEDGTIGPGTVVDVWEAGIKDVVGVATSLGKYVEVTPDHKVLTSEGWVSAGELTISHRVALNGTDKLYQSERWLRQAYEVEEKELQEVARLAGCHPTTIGTYLRKFGVTRRPLKRPDFGGWNRGITGVENHRYVHGRTLAARELRSKLSCCEICGTKEGLQVHHVDKDNWNNERSNLRLLCSQCHAIAHSDTAKPSAVVYDKVLGVEAAGSQRVYDITTVPHHNFVGNGIILHNCIRTVHAEVNAILQCAVHGVSTKGATAYVTVKPCFNCLKLLHTAGIDNIWYLDEYPSGDDDEVRYEELVHQGDMSITRIRKDLLEGFVDYHV